MQIVKTQKILYNHELRIRFIADNEDSEYIRLVRKLPDCRWSSILNSWHTNNIENHILFFNKVFPAAIRFYDISKLPGIPEVEEKQVDKRICIGLNPSDNTLILNFLYDQDLTVLVKKLGGKQLPDKGKAWAVNPSQDILRELNSYLQKSNYRIDYERDSKAILTSISNSSFLIQTEERLRENFKLLNYGKRTIEQYISNVNRFLFSIGQNTVLNPEVVRDYIDEMSISRNYSRSYQNLMINSIKAYYRYIHGVELDRFELPRPKRDKSVPIILSKQEVAKIIQFIPNLKHSVLISTIYVTGIKVSEVLSIRPEDIDRENMRIFICGRNGKAQRTVPVTMELLQNIEIYINCFRPRNYLFEGYNGSQYSTRSIQKVLQKYVQKAGISKNATVHTLRHSCAGHLAAEGIDPGELQKFLGLSSKRSTEIYSKTPNLKTTRI